jgi:hypothetical protein
MKKRIVRLTESDLENLVKRIIKEEEEGENSFDIKDVDNWMNSFKQYFLNKQAGKTATKRINTVPEKAGLVAAFMDFLQVDMAQITMAKKMLKQQQNKEGGQEDLNFDS